MFAAQIFDFCRKKWISVQIAYTLLRRLKDKIFVEILCVRVIHFFKVLSSKFLFNFCMTSFQHCAN